MLTNRQKGLVYGALLADAYALGPHWIYDTDEIAAVFADSSGLNDPHAPYHKGKRKGDFTHYGDQMLNLLEHVAKHKKLDIRRYKKEWIRFVGSHPLYLDSATKDSLELLSDSDVYEGSSSKELGGLVRSAALYILDYVTLDDVIDQTRLTHTDGSLTDIAVFTFRLLRYILQGHSPSEALDIVYPDSSPYIQQQVDLGLKYLDDDTVDTIKFIGQSCSAEYGFPSAIHLIFKYEDDYVTALKYNNYAGGDSAARGMYVGKVLGAYHGYDSLPSDWLSQMNAVGELDRILTDFVSD